MTTKTLYLTNRDLLREIHRSKLTYCWVKAPEFADYDIIITDLKQIHNRKTKAFPDGAINTAKQTRADRLSRENYIAAERAWREGGEKGDKPKQAQFEIDPKSIKTPSLVYRLMTFEHVPTDAGRKSKPKITADHHAKVNFPPFKHYVMTDDGPEEVVRSHWKGTLKKGEFSIDHGTCTRQLALMYMKLCERYSMRSNWRGYTYVDEMRGQALLQLSQIGLQFDESKSQNPFAYYTAAITNSFTRILNIEKRNQHIRDDLLQETGQMPSYTRQIEHEMAMAQERERLAALKETPGE